MNREIPVGNIQRAFLAVKKGEIYHLIIGDIEKILIEKALEETRGNQLFAAKILGLNRNTLRTKIKKLNILVENFKL